MKAEEWLEGYERRDGTTNGEDLAAAIIRALLAENAELNAGLVEFSVMQQALKESEQENVELRARVERLQTERDIVSDALDDPEDFRL